MNTSALSVFWGTNNVIREEQLREIVGHLLQRRPEDLTAGTVLNSNLSGSIGRARLDAALRKGFGFSRPEVYTVATYGQLASAICDTELNTADSGNGRPNAPGANSERGDPTAHHHDVGIDIEAIRNLPDVADYWESPFYKSHFTNTEIGFCLLQPKPLETFAGLWSAKEALKKTAPQWAQLDWQAIEVAHESDGSPYLVVEGADLRPEYSASISHTSEFSIAVVVRVRNAEAPKDITITAPTLPRLPERTSPTRSSRAMSLLLFAILLVLIWYIIYIHK